MNRRERITLLAFAVVFMTTVVVSCGSKAGSLDPISQTLTPMSEQVMGTITARAGNVDKNDDLAVAIAKATSQAQIVYGTETAVAALNEPARLATATAIAPVIAELSFYGIDPSDGYVAWLHPPVTIDLQGYQQTGYANNFQNVTASDLVMAADITWHTFNSASGCGFMFRSNGDTNKPSQYIVLISRLASGHMALLGMTNGELSNFHSFYPKSEDKSFNWFNDATNRLAIVVHGDLVDLYTNQHYVGQVNLKDPPEDFNTSPPPPELLPGATDQQKQDYQNILSQSGSGMDFLSGELASAKKNYAATGGKVLQDGFLGFIGLSQSGTMTCKFENGWLFNLVK
jgi:hypothetical protein